MDRTIRATNALQDLKGKRGKRGGDDIGEAKDSHNDDSLLFSPLLIYDPQILLNIKHYFALTYRRCFKTGMYTYIHRD